MVQLASSPTPSPLPGSDRAPSPTRVDPDFLLKGLDIPGVDRESSRKCVLDVASAKLELHRTRADGALAAYRKSQAALEARKREYEREEDQYNDAMAAYTYFQHVLDKEALDKGTSVLEMDAPPSHARAEAEPQAATAYYKSSRILEFVRRLPPARTTPQPFELGAFGSLSRADVDEARAFFGVAPMPSA
ncbi:hypothetical protein FIBSPDRAFT_871898 [Athelia psychrophila]|uniref:Uncharacterized protein n=1 Tax=Athelia psychrophila TaxID=1759441 RepID=A0A166A0W3_9AGAM|nr:hypothetical protein FIBSPDRAFT_871898 [Fibularhizoctonia sp. CBS 109695]